MRLQKRDVKGRGGTTVGMSVVTTRAGDPCTPEGRGLVGLARGARRWRLVLLAGATALLVVACGGEEAGEDDPEAAGPELGADEESAGAAAEPSPEVDTTEDDADAGEGGVREHRPPEDPDAFADCGSIGEDDPGAVIRFPSDDVSGSLDAGTGPVTVEVVGCGNTFEANVQWEAFHGDNRSPTLEGNTMGGTMGDWDTFSIVETYWTPGDWTVVVFEMDAESGDRREYDQVTFAVG
jgi:hypothetical protein